MTDYKNTLNLPETGFPMRGDLAKREPKMLENWYQQSLYQKIRQAAKGKKVLFCMTVLRMPMVRCISGTPLIRF